MADPITAKKLATHPALEEFVRYVERHTGEPVDLARIEVVAQRESAGDATQNNLKNDGIVELSYAPTQDFTEGKRFPIFYGQINGGAQAIFLRHGWITPVQQSGTLVPRDEWASEASLPTPIPGACAAVHDLGGAAEAKASCQDLSRAGWWGRNAAANAANVLGLDMLILGIDLPRYGAAQFFNLFRSVKNPVSPLRTFPVTRWLGSQLAPVGPQPIAAGSRLAQTVPPALAGATAMFGAQALSDQIFSWDPELHRHDRFAIGVAAGYGAQRGMQYYMAQKGWGGAARLKAASLGSGILTAGLVDALIGDQWAEGSAQRQAIRSSAFFIPAVYRGLMGSRTLSFIAKRPRLAAAGRMAGRVATWAFAADMGLLAFHNLTEEDAETARLNHLYQRAQELRKLHQNGFSNLWRGALETIMPAFTERNTVPEEYLSMARQEMIDQAKGLSDGAAQTLRYELIFGNGGENQNLDFYRRLDFSALRGENRLGVVKKGEGKSDWYLETVARDLADPVIRYHYFQNKTGEEQLRFIKNRYHWDLSNQDVQEILGRIALHQARQDLAQLHSLVNRRELAMADCFDGGGKLNPGKEPLLMHLLFKDLGEVPDEGQVLALRKVALLVRIRTLREQYRVAKEDAWNSEEDKWVIQAKGDLKKYETLALQLGLMDGGGNFTPGEIREFALGIPPAETPPSARRRYGKAEVIQAIMAENASGVL